MSSSKTCYKCKHSLPASAYAKCARNKDGLQSLCNTCAAAYRAANRERHRAVSRAWNNTNAERKRATDLRWQQQNPDRISHYNHTRRNRRLTNGSHFISTRKLAYLYSQPCFYCGSNDRIELDHVMPLSRGGRHSIGNIVPACRSCNRQKNSKTIMEWRLSKKL